MFRKFWASLVALLTFPFLAPRVGYGPRTFVQGLAIICRTLYKYITKHQNTLKANLPDPVYTCITGILPCLLSIMEYLNKSAS